MSPTPFRVLVLTLAASPCAQEPPDLPLLERLSAAVEARLPSEEPAEAAWGAYLAGRLQVHEAVPQLRRVLERWTASDHEESRRVRLYLLDALVRLGAELPGEELAPQLEGFLLPPALILAARTPEVHGALLFGQLQAHWKRGNSAVRQAAGNLLAAEKHPGFAAWLVPRLPLRLHVTVRDVDPAAMGVGNGGAGGSYGSRVVSLPKAYPPVPRFRLSAVGAHGSVLLAPGTVPVYWRRTEDPRRGLVVAKSGSPPPKPGPSAHRWLAAMARQDLERIGLPLFRGELIRFEDAATYLERVVAMREELAAGFAFLCRALVLQNAMTDDEAAALELPLTIEIADERVDREVALPALPERAGGL